MWETTPACPCKQAKNVAVCGSKDAAVVGDPSGGICSEFTSSSLDTLDVSDRPSAEAIVRTSWNSPRRYETIFRCPPIQARISRVYPWRSRMP